MLSAKSWKLQAIVRLLVSMFICIYAGSLVLTAIQVLHGSQKKNIILVLVSVGLILLVAGLVQVQRQWHFETFFRQMLVAMACVYGGMVVGLWAQHLASPALRLSPVVKVIVGTLSFHCFGLILISRFLHEHDTTWPIAFGFYNAALHAVLIGVIAACIFLPIGWWLQEVSGQLIKLLFKEPPKINQQQAVQAIRIASSLVDRLVLIAVTLVFAPLAEEGLFRGILYPWIKRMGYPGLAFCVTSFLFAAMHEDMTAFLPLFVLSALLILLYEKTGNLLACIVTHALFNLANLIKLYLLQKQFS